MPGEVKIKFPMHDMHLKKTLGNMRMACFLGLASAFCFYLLHNVPVKMKYKAFYSNYDPLDAFDRMKNAGYLSSCPKEDKNDDDKKKDQKKK